MRIKKIIVVQALKIRLWLYGPLEYQNFKRRLRHKKAMVWRQSLKTDFKQYNLFG